MEQNLDIARTSDIEEESIGLWYKCTQCSEVSFRGELERNGFICPKCKELFPLSIENRLKLLTGDLPCDREDTTIVDNGEVDSEVTAIVESIDEYHISLFILNPEAALQTQHLKVFSDAIAAAIDKSIPFLSVFTANPIETEISFQDIVPLLLMLEELAEQSLPYLTVLTETETVKLTTHLPLGEIIVAECTSQVDNATRSHPQPALHAPEEQLLPENNRRSIRNIPDISVDCYVPRSELHEVLVRFLKFFSFSPQ